MIRDEFRTHLRKVVPGSAAFSDGMRRAVAPLTEDHLDDLPDLLGDAEEGAFDFLEFEDGAAFKASVEPIAILGARNHDSPIRQIEGLLLAKSHAGKLVELLTVDVDGTLVPGTVASVGKDFAALKLRASTAAPSGGHSTDDED